MEVIGLRETLKALDEIQERITDPKLRRRVMRKPAKIVVDAARRDLPIYRGRLASKGRPRYSTPKVIKSRRAAKGRGRVVATYFPGNLRKSIKRLNFRKTPREFIGPVLAKRGRTKGEFGRGTRVDGYYAQFLRGSRVAFRRAFMEPALRANAAKIVKVAERELDREVAKLKQKTGL